MKLKKVEAFEMWIWRRMLKIKWTNEITSGLVLAIVGEERSLLHTISGDKVNGRAHTETRSPTARCDRSKGRRCVVVNG